MTSSVGGGASPDDVNRLRLEHPGTAHTAATASKRIFRPFAVLNRPKARDGAICTYLMMPSGLTAAITRDKVRRQAIQGASSHCMPAACLNAATFRLTVPPEKTAEPATSRSAPAATASSAVAGLMPPSTSIKKRPRRLERSLLSA